MSNEEIVARLQQGIDTTENQERLWLQNVKFVRLTIRRMCGPYDDDAEDLEQEAFIGLLDAARLYDPEVGASFLHYASFHIKAAILRYHNSCSHSVRTPAYLKSRIRKYEAFRMESIRDRHREPTDQEYVDFLNISYKSLAMLEKTINDIRTVSLDANFLESGDLTLQDLIQSDENLEEMVAYSVYNVELKAALDSALAILDPTTSAMIRSVHYQGNSLRRTAAIFGCSFQSVAERIQRGFWKILHSEHRANLESFMWEGFHYVEYPEDDDPDDAGNKFLI